MEWISPEHCDPPHSVSHPDHAIELANQFLKGGWDRSKPALIGYPWGNKIQLLSGSHRWIAAKMTNTLIPCVVVPFEEVKAAWGDLAMWSVLMHRGDSW